MPEIDRAGNIAPYYPKPEPTMTDISKIAVQHQHKGTEAIEGKFYSVCSCGVLDCPTRQVLDVVERAISVLEDEDCAGRLVGDEECCRMWGNAYGDWCGRCSGLRILKGESDG